MAVDGQRRSQAFQVRSGIRGVDVSIWIAGTRGRCSAYGACGGVQRKRRGQRAADGGDEARPGGDLVN